MATSEISFQQVVDELHKRWPDSALVPTLERVQRLVELMGSPQLSYPTVHIGGTNGKSSTTRMVDALLTAHGLRTGRFTSPGLDLRDRIARYGEPLPEPEFVAAYQEIAPYLPVVDAEFPQRLTIFEVMVPMAAAAFADAPVDVGVFEVGLGGSWDATNVIRSDVAVLTPIALDHQKYLGDTITEIATEKAGIIKPGATVILAGQSEEAARVLLGRCAEVGATVAREGTEFGVRHREVAVGGQLLSLQGLGAAYDDVFLPLHGAHQAQNAALALAAAEALLGAGADGRRLEPDLVRAGFAAATSPGRLEPVRSAPTVLLDAAHNPHGMAATVAALAEDFAFRRLVAVVAIFEDKDAAGMLELLDPVVDAVVVTRNSAPRSMPATQLGVLATEILGHERVTVTADLPDALEAAVRLAEEDPDTAAGGAGVVVTGSIVTMTDARRLLLPANGG